MIRSPVCFLLSPVLILIIIHETTSTNCPVPSRDEWKRRNSECKAGTKYHCLADGDTSIRMAMCAVPVTCKEGTHVLFDEDAKTVSCVSCSRDMYQPTSKSSFEFTQPNCDYRKTPCKPEHGELECVPATSSQDSQCKCDYTRGYRPSSNEKECQCFFTDSSRCYCEKAHCVEGEVLAANYSCVVVGSSTTTSTTVSTTQMYSDTPGESISGGAIAGIAIGTIIAAVVIIVIVKIIVRKCKGRRKRQSDAKIRKPQDEVKESEVVPLELHNEDVNDHEETAEQSGTTFNVTAAANASQVENANAVGKLLGDNIMGNNQQTNVLCFKSICCQKNREED